MLTPQQKLALTIKAEPRRLARILHFYGFHEPECAFAQEDGKESLGVMSDICDCWLQDELPDLVDLSKVKD